jgi:hypothetical protein
MRKQSLAVVFVVAACASSGPSLPRSPQGAPVLTVQGAIRGGPYALGEADLAALPQHAVRGLDPATGREARWEGAALAGLAQAVKIRKGADTLIVRTADGTAVPIPLTVIRQRRPVLATRADGAPVAGRVLAWPNLEQAGLPSDPRQRSWWARDIVALEIVQWQAALGTALATPEGAPDAARLGSDHFAARCVACHRVRGAGGEKGPELTRVATRVEPGAFRALLADHPGWAERGVEAPGPEAVDQVWAFLRAIATATPVEPKAAGAATGN